MDLSAIALQGIEHAQVQLEAAVTGIATAARAASPNGANLDVVDIASQMLAMNSAQTLLQLNLSTLKVADQIQKNVIDLMA